VTIIPNSYRAEINDDNLRLNYEHEKILKIFEMLPQGIHINISELHKSLKKQAKVNIFDVYYTVKNMTEMGVLRELKMDTGQSYYEINDSFPQGHHIICVQCHRMIKFEDNSILEKSIQEAEKNDWHILDCQFTIYGVCTETSKTGCLAIHNNDIN
jgi:Fur family transcriptional regulator, ferric uptake regulator